MKVAVVTPYYREKPDVLARCNQSVVNQTYKDVKHFMVADGFAQHYIDTWHCEHIRLPNIGDSGNSPRVVGAIAAEAQGFNAIVLLDADCWLEPNHVQQLVESMASTGASVVTCPRNLYRPDGTFMAVDTESDGNAFNDTNCYLLHRDVFPTFAAWLFQGKKLAYVVDRMFWNAVKTSGQRIVRSPHATVNYETTLACHYEWNGQVPPEDSRVLVNDEKGFHHISYAKFKELAYAD